MGSNSRTANCNSNISVLVKPYKATLKSTGKEAKKEVFLYCEAGPSNGPNDPHFQIIHNSIRS